MNSQLYKGTEVVLVSHISEWRNWLSIFHKTMDSVWLVIYKNQSNRKTFDIGQAIDEALCFGWIDSKSNSRDDDSYYVYFAKRNPKSNWSRINKQKIKRLISENRMSEAGLEMVQIAKKSGTWDALNDVENLVLPEDMKNLMDGNGVAQRHWEAMPRNYKRGILEWIFNAKKPDTRFKRINEAIISVEKNIRIK